MNKIKEITGGVLFVIFIVVFIVVCCKWITNKIDQDFDLSFAYDSCITATRNTAACEKEVFPKRYKKRLELLKKRHDEEVYYRKRIPVLE